MCFVYVAASWTLGEDNLEKLRLAQRKIKGSILGIRYQSY